MSAHNRSAHHRQLDIRPSPIAGQWYPGNPEQLSMAVDRYLAQSAAPTIPKERVIGILVPHAGYQYSAPVAAHAFRLIRDMEIEQVALIGPSHHLFSAPAVTSGHDAYETPLGTVPVDHATLDELRHAIAFERIRHDKEHSLEIELPFLQKALGDFHLIPLALLDQSWPTVERLGHALADLLRDRKTLLVASSDLSHFYSQSTAHQLDHNVLEAINRYDPQQVIALEEEGKGFACGRGAIAAVMVAARDLGADQAQVLAYGTSGDVIHDYNRVVGYAAAAFYREA